jgi:hypothetical protein
MSRDLIFSNFVKKITILKYVIITYLFPFISTDTFKFTPNYLSNTDKLPINYQPYIWNLIFKNMHKYAKLYGLLDWDA